MSMGVIPEKYRDSIRVELDALANGEHPELMTWVREYSAQLVRQPNLIWSHAESEVVERDDGTAFGVVPLWTAGESPSDLSVEFEIDGNGVATISDVHVL
jgi:hypothetical protein